MLMMQQQDEQRNDCDDAHHDHFGPTLRGMVSVREMSRDKNTYDHVL